jgi:hypothetical protein
MNDAGPLRDYARSRAVLLGAWSYTNLPPVPAAGHSLARMVRLLIGPLCGWPAERVRMIPDATHRGTLPDELMGLYHDVTDVALFYFVGHGQLYGDELCLALTESPADGPRRRTTGLPFADVREALSECDAHIKIVILDCCFSGIGTQRHNTLAAATDADEVNVIDRASVTGAVTMAASAAYRTAWHEPHQNTGNSQTYFTKYLINTIEQGLPDHPEGLPLRAIFDRTADALARDRLPEPTRSVRHNADRFILAHNAALLPVIPPQQPAAQPRTPPPIVAQPQLPKPGVNSHPLYGAVAQPAPLQPIVFQPSQNQRIYPVLNVIFWSIVFIALAVWMSKSHFILLSQAGTKGGIIGGYFGIATSVAKLAVHLRSKLVLTEEGIRLTRWKRERIPWSEIKAVQMGRQAGMPFNPRRIRFVLADRSILSGVPVDGWGARDPLFDHKLRTIQQLHVQFGAPEPWWPSGRSSS